MACCAVPGLHPGYVPSERVGDQLDWQQIAFVAVFKTKLIGAGFVLERPAFGIDRHPMRLPV